jgi:hypothetical protein
VYILGLRSVAETTTDNNLLTTATRSTHICIALVAQVDTKYVTLSVSPT